MTIEFGGVASTPAQRLQFLQNLDTLTPAQAGPVRPIYAGAWAGRPDASVQPDRTRMWVTDIGANGGTWWRAVAGVWRLESPAVLLVSKTSFVGVANSTAEQLLATYGPLPRSALDNLRHYSVSFAVSKSGVATTFQANIREGTTGTLADTSVYSSGGPLGSAANRTGSAGVIRELVAGVAQTMTATFNSALESSSAIVTVRPLNPSTLANADVFWSVTLQAAALAADIPSVDRFTLIGY